MLLVLHKAGDVLAIVPNAIKRGSAVYVRGAIVRRGLNPAIEEGYAGDQDTRPLMTFDAEGKRTGYDATYPGSFDTPIAGDPATWRTAVDGINTVAKAKNELQRVLDFVGVGAS